ncbi:MAG: sel1 repeat family protein [Hyphomonadaceae bacterium]|nr:sel1 repeat family protein [Hyphomonadaceae bacterium]
MAFTDVEIAEAHQAAHTQAAPEDLYKLGLIYSTGQGAEIDLVQAHKWFNLAALRGSQPAKECRKELADQMTSMEIAAAQRQAREWLSRSPLH